MDGADSTPAKAAGIIFARVESNGSITAEDVMALRRAIYGSGNIGEIDVDAIFRVDHACPNKDDKWTEFYVDALTDYFIWQTKPPEYITEDQGEFLIRNLLRDNRVAGITELQLLVNLSHWAISTPELFKVLVLEAVRDSVLEPDEALYGSGRKPGVVTEVDVEILREALYGLGGFGGFVISQHEAEVIFEIEDATDGADNADEWQDLFVKTVANFLMFPRGESKVVSVEEYQRREKWLKERRGVAGLFKEIGKSALSFEKWKEGWKHMDTFGTQARRAQAEKERDEIREALSRESIDEGEAHWLVGKVNANGKVTENERKLLEFIREYSPSIDPRLDGMMHKLGI